MSCEGDKEESAGGVTGRPDDCGEAGSNKNIPFGCYKKEGPCKGYIHIEDIWELYTMPVNNLLVIV